MKGSDLQSDRYSSFKTFLESLNISEERAHYTALFFGLELDFSSWSEMVDKQAEEVYVSEGPFIDVKISRDEEFKGHIPTILENYELIAKHFYGQIAPTKSIYDKHLYHLTHGYMSEYLMQDLNERISHLQSILILHRQAPHVLMEGSKIDAFVNLMREYIYPASDDHTPRLRDLMNGKPIEGKICLKMNGNQLVYMFVQLYRERNYLHIKPHIKGVLDSWICNSFQIFKAGKCKDLSLSTVKRYMDSSPISKDNKPYQGLIDLSIL